MPAPCQLSPQQRRKARIAALMGFIFVMPVTSPPPLGHGQLKPLTPSDEAVFLVKGEAGLRSSFAAIAVSEYRELSWSTRSPHMVTNAF